MPYTPGRFLQPSKKGPRIRPAMISNALTLPADAASPDADRAGPAVPANVAALLYVVCTLLEYGRHLAATLGRRAAMPGLSLFAALFGTARLPVILAHLRRSRPRATTFESRLLKRVATGHDVALAPLRVRASSRASGTNAKAAPLNEPHDAQCGRPAVERAKYDVPADPGRLPTLQGIEAGVRRDPFGRAIAGICRNLGVAPGLRTPRHCIRCPETFVAVHSPYISLRGA
jgi:hypothetical protein